MGGYILIIKYFSIVYVIFVIMNNYDEMEITMPTDKRSKKTKDKKQDGAFPSKNIKHDPQAESARAKFGKDTVAEE